MLVHITYVNSNEIFSSSGEGQERVRLRVRKVGVRLGRALRTEISKIKLKT